MSRTCIGALLESANSVDILLYVHDHPLCLKSEIYRNVSRNAHTRELIGALASEGLLAIRPAERGNAHVLELTDKGQRVAELLLEIEDVLG